MRGMIALAGLTLLLAIGGTRGWVPRPLGLMSAAAFLLAIALVARFGLRMHRQILAERERRNRVEMILLIAGQLVRHDDISLREIAARGGPVGEAADMLLDGRRERTRRS